MPQLMPLSWIFSNLAIITFVYIMLMIYGENLEKYKIFHSSKNMPVFNWCW